MKQQLLLKAASVSLAVASASGLLFAASAILLPKKAPTVTPSPVVTDLVSSQPQDFEVAIANPLDRDLMVLGARYFCGAKGCLTGATQFPFTVPARSEGKYRFTFRIIELGSFDVGHDVYTEAGTLHMRLTGNVRRAPLGTIALERLQSDQPIALPDGRTDLGRIEQGGRIQQAFRLHNTSTGIYVITGGTTSCECATVTDLPAKLGPGESGTFQLTVDMASDPNFAGELELLVDFHVDNVDMPTLKALVAVEKSTNVVASQ